VTNEVCNGETICLLNGLSQMSFTVVQQIAKNNGINFTCILFTGYFPCSSSLLNDGCASHVEAHCLMYVVDFHRQAGQHLMNMYQVTPLK
jgi:hypothetical protein